MEKRRRTFVLRLKKRHSIPGGYAFKKSKTKGIAINGVPIRRSSELIGLLNVVFFSPEDLQVIKTVLESADAFGHGALPA